MKRILISKSLVATLLLSGCAVKETDHIVVKAVKHTLMTPVYAGEVLTKARDLALIGTAAVIVKGYS